MPIKFRCEHCRQLLGISRSKAGQISDCPTCGRSVRVPELDGRREPVPAPQLDLDDSRLAGALNELAQIGLDPEDGVAAAAAVPDQTQQKVEVITPDLLPDPVPMEPPPVQQRVEPQPPPSSLAPEGAPSANRSTSTDEALSELARHNTSPEQVTAAKPRLRLPSLKTLLSMPVMGVVIGAIVIGFGLGYLAGSATTNETSPAINGNGSEPPPSSNDHAATKLAVKGRITYKNEDGDSRPDRQARVLVFPHDRVGQRKLDITGLRAGDSPDDFRSAAAAFRALGGDVTLVDKEGSFEISLPAAGTYQILVLSNYQPRDTDEATAAPLSNLLSQYFDRPGQLLGRVAYHFAQIRYKGADAVLWDHSF